MENLCINYDNNKIKLNIKLNLINKFKNNFGLKDLLFIF